jgi:hypothetical protein
MASTSRNDAADEARSRWRAAFERRELAQAEYERVFGGRGLPKQEAALNRARANPNLRPDQWYPLFLQQPEMSTPEAMHARAESKEAWDALVRPEFLARISRGVATPQDLEDALAFMEVDIWLFHSGYIKQKLARYFRHCTLTKVQRSRLQAVILSALTKGRREELDELARLARYIDEPRFRTSLEKHARSSDDGVAWRASRVLDKCRMNDYRKDLRGAR